MLKDKIEIEKPINKGHKKWLKSNSQPCDPSHEMMITLYKEIKTNHET
jgi:hypothetical protein